MYNTILITGGNGMIGKAMQRLEMNGIYVTRNDANLENYQQTYELFNKIKPDAVIHLASIVGGLYYNINNNSDMLYKNTQIHLNVVKCCVEMGVKKVILVSSTCTFPVYNDIMTEEDALKDYPDESNFGYAMSKRTMDILGRMYSKTSNTKFITLYPCNLYGLDDNKDIRKSHVISGLIEKFINDDFTVFGSGIALRQFLYVDDCAKLIWDILNRDDCDYNLILSPSPKDEISISELAIKIMRVFEKDETKIRYDLDKSDGVLRKTVSNKKLLEFFPDFKFTSLDEGLEIICMDEYYRSIWKLLYDD